MGTFPTVTLASLGISDPQFTGILRPQVWSERSLTYSFSDFDQWSSRNPVVLSGEGQQLMRKILQQVEGVTELTFREVEEDATIDFFQNSGLLNENLHGYAWYPHINGGFVSFAYADPYPYISYHEVLHSLGFDHPNVAVLPEAYQNGQLTAMYPQYHKITYDAAKGYNVEKKEPTGLLAHDIETLQAVYGVNSASAGDDTYYYDTAVERYEGLFDAGGVDTIRITDTAKKGVSLNLTPGGGLDVGTTHRIFSPTDSTVDFTVGETVFTTRTTVIERVVLADGDDFVQGNDADNYIVANGGDDTVLGGGGADAVWAGKSDAGADYFSGGAGNDVLGAGAGKDLLVGGDGRDTLYGGSGDDTVLAGGWDDANISGTYDAGEALTESTDGGVIYVGTGNDTAHGASGRDTIGGGAGDDMLNGAGGDDVLYGAAGADTLQGGDGNDVVFNGTGADTVDGGAGDDTLYGGPGNDALTGGAGSDIFTFSPSNGQDVVTDFTTGQDKLDLTQVAFAAFADVQNAMTEQADGLLIDLGGATVLLHNIAIADLTEADFIL